MKNSLWTLVFAQTNTILHLAAHKNMKEVEVMYKNMKRGDVYIADLEPIVGSEQGGVRPVLVVQNDLGNKSGSTVIVAAMTTSSRKPNLPTHIALDNVKKLEKETTVLLEQIRTIDKARLKSHVVTLNEANMRKIDEALLISMGLNDIIHTPFRMFLCTECALRLNYSREYNTRRVDGSAAREKCMQCYRRDGFYYDVVKTLDSKSDI